MSDEIRQAVRQEMERQKQATQFWASLHDNFPVTRGHRPLAERLLHKHMATMADMTPEEGIEFLGDAITKELNRVTRRDADPSYNDALVMRGSHDDPDGSNHNASIDALYQAPGGFGDTIKKRRAMRRDAARQFDMSPAADRREHRNR